MAHDTNPVLAGENLDEAPVMTLNELCHACTVHTEWVIELVNEGIITPAGRDSTNWRFYGASMRRALVVRRLQQDLGVNLAGAALALELMDEIDTLRARLHAETAKPRF
ncbi:chaperone modulator CbpM [Halomonas sp. WWR20]